MKAGDIKLGCRALQEPWPNPQVLRAKWPFRATLSWAYVASRDESLDGGCLGKWEIIEGASATGQSLLEEG